MQRFRLFALVLWIIFLLIDSLLYVDAVQAFVKRLLQVCQLFTPPLICASLVLVSELVKLRPTLLRLSKLAQVHDCIWLLPGPLWPTGRRWSPFLQPSASLHTVRDCGYGTSTSRAVTVYTPAFAGTKLYCLTSGAHGVNNLPIVVTLPHTGRGLNSRPLDCKFDAMRLHHHATRTWCTEQYLVVIREMNGTVSSVSNWNQMHVQILISTVLNWWQ